MNWSDVVAIVTAVQAKLAVPVPKSVKVHPEGREPPVSVKAGSGVPVAVTLNVVGIPRGNVAAFAEVKTGRTGAEVESHAMKPF